MLAIVIDFLRDILKNHKKKVFSSVLFALAFTVILFPYGDLSDLITAKVAQATRNQVYVQFEELGFNFFPTPGIKLGDVSLDTPKLPTLNASQLVIRPSILSLLTFKPGLSLRAYDFLDGQMWANYKSGKKINKELRMQNVEIELENISLSRLNEILELPFEPSGAGVLTIEGAFDPSFETPPEATAELSVDGFSAPSFSLPMGEMGAFPVPKVKLKKVMIKTELKDKSLVINEAEIGSAGDPLAIRLKGSMGLDFIGAMPNVRPRFSTYDLSVDLTLGPRFSKDFGILSAFLGKYKKAKGQTTNFLFRISGNLTRLQDPPRLSDTQSF